MNKIKYYVISSILLTVGVLGSNLLNPGVASAFTTTPPAVTSSLTQWNWRNYVYCDSPSEFPLCTGSAVSNPIQYVVFKLANDDTNERVRIALNQNPCADLTFYNVSGDNKLALRLREFSSKNPATRCLPAFSSSIGTYAATGYYTFRDGSQMNPNSPSSNYVTIDSAIIGAIVGVQGAVNVTYNSSYTGGHFSSAEVPYTATGASESCSNLDIGCKIAAAFGVIGDSIKDLVQGAVNVFARFFMPDPTAISASFTSLNDFLQLKLGFLTYPVTFLVDFFAAFSSTSDSWCSSGGCSKSFGNFWGQNFTINLTQMQTTMPTMWTWFVALVRGLTVLELILVIRRKYLGVMSR